MKKLTLAIVAILLSLGITPVSAENISFDAKWKEQRFSLFSKNRYGFKGQELTVQSRGSVSMAYVSVEASIWNARTATWRWNVNQGVEATDLRKKGGDDRNLSIYAVFMPTDRAKLLRNAGIRKLLSEESARVLVYVWGGAHKRGALLDSPYLGARGKTIVLRGSGSGDFNEAVDLGRDYQRAFGATPGALVGLAVSADSDDTGGAISASIRNLTLN